MAELYEAIESNDIEEVKRLLEDGVDINKVDEHGATYLHFAAFEGNTQIALLLIEHGADIHAEDHFGNQPFYMAVLGKQKEMQELLENKDLKRKSTFIQTLKKLNKQLEELHELGFTYRRTHIDAKSPGGFTPLVIGIVDIVT